MHLIPFEYFFKGVSRRNWYSAVKEVISLDNGKTFFGL